MNLFKRGYYSIRNNLKKSLILFSIVFVLGNVICGSLAITQSISNMQNEFRKYYGAKIHIYSKDGIDFPVKVNLPSDDYYKGVRKAVEKIYDGYNFKYAYTDLNYYLKGLFSDTVGYKDEDEWVYGDNVEIYSCGVTTAQMGLIKNYKLELIEGRSFSDEELEKGKNVILVSDAFYVQKGNEYVNVEVGDTLTFKRKVGEHVEDVDYEVIGIYKRYDNVMVAQDRYSFDNHIARVYMPANTLFKEEERFSELNKEYLNDEMNLSNTVFLGDVYLRLQDNDSLGRMIAIIDDDLLGNSSTSGVMYYSSTDEIYKKISAPIESMSGIANFLLISSSILCVLILTVTVFILIRNRKHEIGILISLGETKMKVILQIILEIYLVGILALGCSMITGNKLGQMYSNYLVSEQVEESREDLSIDETKLQDELLDTYAFELSKGYIISVISVGTFVLFLSVMIPVGYVVRLKPKEILL